MPQALRSCEYSADHLPPPENHLGQVYTTLKRGHCLQDCRHKFSSVLTCKNTDTANAWVAAGHNIMLVVIFGCIAKTLEAFHIFMTNKEPSAFPNEVTTIRKLQSILTHVKFDHMISTAQLLHLGIVPDLGTGGVFPHCTPA